MFPSPKPVHLPVPLVVVLAFVAAAQPAPAWQVEAGPYAAIEQRARAFVEERGVVGLSLGLIVDGVPAHRAHFGWEDREAQTPASDRTMYRWASISKPLTAVVAMQLEAEGRLDLHGDVRRLVPEFPDKGKPITPFQLLCHQGGIVHYTNGPVVRIDPPAGLENPYREVIVALGTFQESPLVNDPGEKFSYTTHGYMLLGAAVERAGTQGFAEQVRRRISVPLGLTTLRPDYQWEVIEHRAVGYVRSGGETRRSTNTDVSWKLAGGGWISTVGDLAGFGAGMLGDRLMSAETKGRMWSRQKTTGGIETGYGLGFAVSNAEGKLVVSHSGSQEKASTYLLLVPEQRIGVAIMCNTEGTPLAALAGELSNFLAPTLPAGVP